jgi:hypothetical protein
MLCNKSTQLATAPQLATGSLGRGAARQERGCARARHRTHRQGILYAFRKMNKPMNFQPTKTYHCASSPTSRRPRHPPPPATPPFLTRRASPPGAGPPAGGATVPPRLRRRPSRLHRRSSCCPPTPLISRSTGYPDPRTLTLTPPPGSAPSTTQKPEALTSGRPTSHPRRPPEPPPPPPTR